MKLRALTAETVSALRQRLMRRPWLALNGLIALSLTVLASGAFATYRSMAEHRRLEAKTNALLAALAVPAEAASEPSATKADFVTKLPLYADVRPVFAELQRGSSAAGVVLGDVQSQERSATTELLGQTELNVQLRGSYPNLKQVLIELVARYPYVTVRRLTLRRTGGPKDIEAAAVLTLWSRPLLDRAPPASGGS